MTVYDLKSIVIDCNRYSYFYKREKNDVNGNPRFRVWLIDPEGGAVHEKVFRCYECQITASIANMIQQEA